jgi:hypothetical protein
VTEQAKVEAYAPPTLTVIGSLANDTQKRVCDTIGGCTVDTISSS